jgi:hypothetical protein
VRRSLSSRIAAHCALRLVLSPWERLPVLGSPHLPASTSFGVGCIDLWPGAVPKCDLGPEIDPLQVVAAIPGGEEDTRPRVGCHDRVGGHRRAVDEVPSPQAPFLVFDDQDALAHQDQEVLLHRLRVVQTPPADPGAQPES